MTALYTALEQVGIPPSISLQSPIRKPPSAPRSSRTELQLAAPVAPRVQSMQSGDQMMVVILHQDCGTVSLSWHAMSGSSD